ncbi:MAG: hypothetical protein RIB45_07430 [Marivibrio sp.]|uniref:hypothetical protein n=1 Tax=Marivibrio sp. TaxID=2039719 RepID=UPI0032EB8C89
MTIIVDEKYLNLVEPTLDETQKVIDQHVENSEGSDREFLNKMIADFERSLQFSSAE